MAVTLPAAMLVVCWWRTGRVTLRDLLGVAPFFAVGPGLALHDMSFYARMRPGAVVDIELSLAERVLTASQGVWFYVGKLLWPIDLAVIYPRCEIDATSIRAWPWPAAGLAAAGPLWGLRHRIGRGPLAGAAFFVVTLSPLLNLVDHNYMNWSFVADRYQYLASAAMAALFAVAAARVLEGRSRSLRTGALCCCVAVVAALGVLTWRQAGVYRDDILLNRHIISLNPEARHAHMNLGWALFKAGRYEKALAATRTAIVQLPSYGKPRANAAQQLIALERFDEAERGVREGLEVAPFDARLRLYGKQLSERRMYEKALEGFETATGPESEGRDAFARGALLLRTGRYREARCAAGWPPMPPARRTAHEQPGKRAPPCRPDGPGPVRTRRLHRGAAKRRTSARWPSASTPRRGAADWRGSYCWSTTTPTTAARPGGLPSHRTTARTRSISSEPVPARTISSSSCASSAGSSVASIRAPPFRHALPVPLFGPLRRRFRQCHGCLPPVCSGSWH